MPKDKKAESASAFQLNDQGGVDPCPAYPLGLYSGRYSAGKLYGQSLSSKMLPYSAITFSLGYVMVASGIWAWLHSFLAAVMFILTLSTLLAVYRLVRADGEFRPARRGAGIAACMIIADYWFWFYGSYGAGGSFIFLILSEGLRLALIFMIYLFIFHRLHIEKIFTALLIKGLFDVGSYIVCGGMGFNPAADFGLKHPLEVDTALFSTAMLELWSVFFYILKYKNKILPPGADGAGPA